jgi:hypothetical protein
LLDAGNAMAAALGIADATIYHLDLETADDNSTVAHSEVDSALAAWRLARGAR